MDLALPAVAIIDADPMMMERVLNNLLSNACEASSEKLELALHLRGGKYVLAVTNEANDLDPTDLPFLFNPFVTKGKQHGTGLGLAIVNRLVKMHHGTVKADLREQRLTITVELPAEQQKKPVQREALAVDKISRVAIVEDSVFIRQAWLQHLSSEEVRGFASAEEFLEAAKADNFDIVICDLYLPGQSGVELLSSLSNAPSPPELFLMTNADVGEEELPPRVTLISKTPVTIAELKRLRAS